MASARPTAPRSPLSLIELVSAHLEARKGDLGATRVYGVLDFADARKSLHTPCLAAMVIADDFGESMSADSDEGIVQRDTATVAVIAVVSAKNDLGGRKGATEDRLTPLVTATREALLGWSPEGEFVGRELVRRGAPYRALFGPSDADLAAPAARWRPLALRRGRLVSIAEGRAWWQDEYTTHRLVHGAPSAEIPGTVPDTLCVTVNDEGPAPLAAVG